MTPRERYLESLLFGKPDKVTLSPGLPRESTFVEWHKQGFPEGADYHTVLLDILGIEPEPVRPMVGLDVSFRMIPDFEEKVLEHRDGHYIVQDWMGAITEISDRYDYSYIQSAKDFVTRKWHKFPVSNRKDWEDMVLRYDPKTPGRHPEDLDARCEALKDRDAPLILHFNGPFWQLREWLGLENLCVFMVEDPEFVKDMIETWIEFISRTMEPILSRVTPDQVGFSEDMAYKAHSMISPDMARRFLMPAYNRWVPEITAAGCELIFMDSDGHIGELLPIWIEAGINCCGPVEVAAGNDIVEYRREYGDKMAFTGGIDKRAMATGGRVMEDEVLRVVPPLLEQGGGLIPGCDHGVPSDISWPDYIECSRLLARLTGWI